MNKITSVLVCKMTVFISLIFILGCMSKPWRVTDTNIKTEIAPSKHLEKLQIVIFEKPEGFSIRGDMREKHRVPSMPIGHIDIDIVDGKGRVLHKTMADIHRSGKANRFHKRYKFNIEVPLIPPEGSTIRVAHHEAALH